MSPLTAPTQYVYCMDTIRLAHEHAEGEGTVSHNGEVAGSGRTPTASLVETPITTLISPPLAESTPAPGPGLPLLVGPLWPARLRALQEYPGRWARWPGRSTNSPAASTRSVAHHAGGLAGSYTLRTSIAPGDVTLICARWIAPVPGGPACRACGCTDNRACPGGCEWVEADLCSNCGSVDLMGLVMTGGDAVTPGPWRDCLEQDGTQDHTRCQHPRCTGPEAPASVAVPAPEDGTADCPCREVAPPADPRTPSAGSTTDDERFPFTPLADVAQRRWPDGGIYTRLAEFAGVHRKQISRWRTAGVPTWAADRLAVALGLHPADLWPEFLFVEAAS